MGQSFRPACQDAVSTKGDIRFTVDDEPGVDVVVVINYSKYDATFRAREGYVWTWPQRTHCSTPLRSRF